MGQLWILQYISITVKIIQNCPLRVTEFIFLTINKQYIWLIRKVRQGNIVWKIRIPYETHTKCYKWIYGGITNGCKQMCLILQLVGTRSQVSSIIHTVYTANNQYVIFLFKDGETAWQCLENGTWVIAGLSVSASCVFGGSRTICDIYSGVTSHIIYLWYTAYFFLWVKMTT